MAGPAGTQFSSMMLHQLFLEKDQQGHPSSNTDFYGSCSGFSISEVQHHLIQLPHRTGFPSTQDSPLQQGNATVSHCKRQFEKLMKSWGHGASTELVGSGDFPSVQSPS